MLSESLDAEMMHIFLNTVFSSHFARRNHNFLSYLLAAHASLISRLVNKFYQATRELIAESGSCVIANRRSRCPLRRDCLPSLNHE